MLKLILTSLVVIISVYWIGEKTRRNPKIDLFLTTIEGRYAKVNELLENSTTSTGLKFLKKLYGWLSVVLLIVIISVQNIFKPNPQSIFPIFLLFSISFMGWFSIKWVLEHKSEVANFSRDNAIMVFGPLVMGATDYFLKTPFTSILISPLYQLATQLHLSIPEITNPLAIGSFISLLFLAFFGVYYLLTWLITIPIFSLSVILVVLPIKFARFIATIDRQNTFFWFTVFLMAIISLWLTQI